MIRVALVAAIAVAAPGCKKRPKPVECRPSVSIVVDWPGATPQEVETNIVLAVEEAVARLGEVRAIHSLAASGRAAVEVEIDGDPHQASAEILEALQRAGDSFPDDVDPPWVRPVTSFDRMILATGPADAERAEAIERELEANERIRSVVALGVRTPEIRVEVDPARIAALGIDADRVASAIRGQGLSGGGLSLRTDDRRDVGQVVLSPPGQPEVKLSDVATVTESFAETPAVYAGGERVSLFAILYDRMPPLAAQLRKAGVVPSEWTRASSCPRGIARRLSVTTARAIAGGPKLAERLAELPVAVLDGVDFLDRGEPAAVEVIALADSEGVERALREVPDLQIIPVGPTVEVELSAADGADRIAAARAVDKATRDIEGVAAVELGPRLDGEPEVQVRVDRQAAARHGISVHQISLAVRRARQGEVAAIYRQGGRPLPVRVFVGASDDSIDALRKIPLAVGDKTVPLGAVAQLELTQAVPIVRRDQTRVQRARIVLADRDAESRVVKAVKAAVAGLDREVELRVGRSRW